MFLFHSKFIFSLAVKIKILRDSTCDIACIPLIFQDGGQFTILAKIFQESLRFMTIVNVFK